MAISSALTRKIGETEVSAIGYGAMGIAKCRIEVIFLFICFWLSSASQFMDQSVQTRSDWRCVILTRVYHIANLLLTAYFRRSSWTRCTSWGATIGTPRTCMALLRISLANGELLYVLSLPSCLTARYATGLNEVENETISFSQRSLASPTNPKGLCKVFQHPNSRPGAEACVP